MAGAADGEVTSARTPAAQRSSAPALSLPSLALRSLLLLFPLLPKSDCPSSFPSSSFRRWKVEKQVLESNPLLEAFGNARTLRLLRQQFFGFFCFLQRVPPPHREAKRSEALHNWQE